MSGDVSLHGDTGCQSCGHADCQCTCCWPRLEPTPTAACPDCDSDCVAEGLAGYWCPGCRRYVSPADVIWFERESDDDF